MRITLPTLFSRLLCMLALVAGGSALAEAEAPISAGGWAEIGTPMRIIQAAHDSAQAANQQDRQRRRSAGGKAAVAPDWPQIVADWQRRVAREPALAQRRLGELQLSGMGLERNEAQALELFAKAAALGDKRAAAFHAALVLSGRVLDHDHDAAALAALETAAKAGDTLAMVVLGRALVEGRALDRNLAQAAWIYRTAAQRGDPVAQVAWARAQLFGLGTAVDAKSAMATLAKAAAAGDEEAQLMRAMGQIRGVGLPQDREAGLRSIRRMAEAGVARAQINLGAQCHDGTQGPGSDGPDIPQAVAWWGKAAAQGWGRAHYNLAVLYREGAPGLAVDDALALQHARLGAEIGDTSSQEILAEMLAHGIATGKDMAGAIRWWRAAANQGDPYAMMQIAARRLDGVDLPKDEARALSNMQTAAQLGLDLAQYSAGEMLLSGVGGPVDRETAAYWFGLAAAQGHEASAKRLAEMRGN